MDDTITVPQAALETLRSGCAEGMQSAPKPILPDRARADEQPHMGLLARTRWIFFVLALTFASEALRAQGIDWPQLQITPVASGAEWPVQITHAGDGSGRIFVAQGLGQIRVIKDGGFLSTAFLDISERVNTCGNGLCSVAFPPGYATNQHFYVDYNRISDGAAVVSRFSVTSNSDIADPASEEVMLTVPQSFFSEGGGQLAFGPDGYLYISLGDASYDGDPANVAQTPDSLLGKLLRIDPESAPSSYVIPVDNPFVGNPVYRPEIWATGLHQPWRFSFDRLTGDLYLGDVGESAWQEIDFQGAGAGGGQNYGWRIMEGNHTNNVPPGFDLGLLSLPAVEYGSTFGSGVTGGFVYRGPGSARMQGMYFYGDRASGRIWGMKQAGSDWQTQELIQTPYNIVSFGEDEAGRLYFASFNSSSPILLVEDTGAAAPATFSPSPGTYNSEQQVVLSSITPGSAIHYTTNGSTPSESDPVFVTGNSIAINGSLTLKARVFRPDLAPSDTSSGVYQLVVATPTFNPSAGPITNGTVIAISTASSGAVVRYTVDGSDPDSSSAVCSSAVSINGNVVLKAKGFKPGFSDSAIQGMLFSLIDYDDCMVTTFAGDGQAGTNDGWATSARFSSPAGICIDSSGTLYVADAGNHRIRRITATGAVTTVAGTGVAGFRDGAGVIAQFSSPIGVCVDGAGNIYVADNGNHRIRKIDSAGNVSTFAGSGSSAYQDGPPASAGFMNLQLLASDVDGSCYVGDWARIRKLSPSGVVTTLAGSGVNRSDNLSGDLGVCVDKFHSVFATTDWGLVFQVSPSGAETLLAGSPSGGVADGPRTNALFSVSYSWDARGVAADRLGNLYVGDYTRVRRIGTNGWVSTLAGSVLGGSSDGDSRSARFGHILGVCVDAGENVYVADAANNTIRKIAFRDSDGDGIPDSFEGAGTPYVVGVDDRCVDSDGDGMGNAAEFRAGTDPLDAKSLLSIYSTTMLADGSTQITWRSVLGVTYLVKCSDDLRIWRLLRAVPGNGSILSIIDSTAASQGSHRFYRVFVSDY